MQRSLDYFSLGHPLVAFRSHFAMRARRRMFELFMRELSPNPQSKILDLGVTPDTSLPESNFFEALYPYPRQITAASIEDASCIESKFPGVRFSQIGRGPLPYSDKQFDMVFCSAVLEHVGTRAEQAQFVREVIRVSKAFFLTTPNRWFPVDFHTLLPFAHWLPQNQHQEILRSLGHDFLAQTENLNLLSGKDVLSLFPQTVSPRLCKLRLAGWTSNLVVYGRS
jgi:SAM-dependent methyltransferase